MRIAVGLPEGGADLAIVGSRVGVADLTAEGAADLTVPVLVGIAVGIVVGLLTPVTRYDAVQVDTPAQPIHNCNV